MPTRQRRFQFGYLFLLLSLLSLATAQCGPANEPAMPEVVPATLHWVTWEMTSRAEKTLIDQFSEQYPHVEFKREDFSQQWEHFLAQTPPPDLLNSEAGFQLDAMIRQGKLADLTELWDETGLLAQVPESLQQLTARDGKQFYMPFGFGWVGIYYNKQVFANYNLQPPQSWDEFIQICETLRANGETPLAISGDEPWVSYTWFEYLNLRMNGPEFHRALLSGKERYDDARVRAVLERWKALFDNGYFVEKPNALGALDVLIAIVRDEKVRDMTREKAVMVLSDTYSVSQLPTLFLGELDFFRFPLMDPSVPTVEAVNPFGYVVPVAADHIPQTLAFLAHIGRSEAQAIVAQEGMFSTVTYAPARVDVASELLRFDQRQAQTMIQESDELVPQMWAALPRTMWGMITFEFNRFIREPHDVEIFMRELEEAREKALAGGQLTGE